MNAIELLRERGLRATRQRVALLSSLLKAREPRSADTLAKPLHTVMDLATVYRALQEFERAGLARKISLRDGIARFEALGEHHHHIVCDSCGRMEDVDLCLPVSVLQELKRRAPGFARIDDHALEFSGVCKACYARDAKP